MDFTTVGLERRMLSGRIIAMDQTSATIKEEGTCRHEVQALKMPFVISCNPGVQDVLYDLVTRDKRSVYENKCRQLCAIRRVLADILQDDTRWLELKATIQKATLNLPAFQDELIKSIPEWQIR